VISTLASNFETGQFTFASAAIAASRAGVDVLARHRIIALIVRKIGIA
jgi:hypothetical protein